jgi:hypothetical protein
VLGFGLGFLLGEKGYTFDGEVKYGSGKAWFESLHPVLRYVVSLGMDVLHHWEYGILSIYLGHRFFTGDLQVFSWYFGWGMVVSDFKDYNNILVRLGIKQAETDEADVKPQT